MMEKILPLVDRTRSLGSLWSRPNRTRMKSVLLHTEMGRAVLPAFPRKRLEEKGPPFSGMGRRDNLSRPREEEKTGTVLGKKHPALGPEDNSPER